MFSSARSIAARMMPNGSSPRVADEVRHTLETPVARSDEHDIQRIVRHATAEVPFYQKFAGASFDDLPVVAKPMMVTQPQKFFATNVQPDRLASRQSTGTSGITFRSYFDDERIARHRAELVGAYQYLGADPFGNFLHCRAWHLISRRARASYALRGQKLYAAEQDEESVRDVAQWLRHRRGVVIIGICSYIEILLERFDALGIVLPPGTVSVVLGAGEPATAYLASMVRRQFGIDLRMRYSNAENGLFGFSSTVSSTYKLDTSTFHVEILRHDSDTPAPVGAVGRIVVTDLYNRAMPFLRYDTGDLGRFSVDVSGHVMPNVLAELGGRGGDFPIAGTRDAPRRATHFKILKLLEQIQSVRQFQLRQHDVGRFTWILNAERSPGLDAELRRILDDELGDIISCEFVYADGALHVGAGKRQTFVNEIPEPDELFRAARP
ncbi:hypothetical protein CFK38_01310 [Brachybacterium vulturis]|uniref:CoF synthetase n=1 Tax=Brachybacterium vulturis TaxID=2017484 RepID=A0A291GJC6_9MICO|nr:hypothetical protein [Brachybacterium vulturis]ATG50311.1 hypothetical protein CFK38_01310 [Brachybacterium vulturis]